MHRLAFHSITGRVMLGPLLALTLFLVHAVVATPASAAEQPDQSEWTGVERIVAMGDVHGDYDAYRKILLDAGVTDERGKWIAGKTHFVQVGDLPDRGPDTDKVIEHLMKLEKQARKAGGRVHALIGNHEAMNMLGDLRYVHPGEYKALSNSRSKRLRENYYEQFVAYLATQPEPPVFDEAFRNSWMEEHPLGYVEHLQHWHPQGEFGRWVLGHNAVIKINDVLFVHGGLGPAMLSLSLDQINAQIREELAAEGAGDNLLVDAEDGPLWYRGLAARESEEEEAHLEALLNHFDAKVIVTGHTPGLGTVLPRYEGRVLVIDSGISAHYGGYHASLLIEQSDFFVLQGGDKTLLPRTDAEVLPYFQRMQALVPESENLAAEVLWLKAPPAPETAVEAKE